MPELEDRGNHAYEELRERIVWGNLSPGSRLIEQELTGRLGVSRTTRSSTSTACLNPSDIAGIQVLKGPTAAAAYGSEAVSGVIVITTQRGSEGRPEWRPDVPAAAGHRAGQQPGSVTPTARTPT